MSPIVLHGGGEFLPGDEPFLRLVLEAAVERARRRANRATTGEDRPAVPLIAVVPTAAADERPELAGANGVAAFELVAAASGVVVAVETILVVDPVSATDPGLCERLAAADAIVLPGGDPAIIASLLADSPAWTAIRSAHTAGATLAGASAGAMVLAPFTWTARGAVAGLGLVPGLVVMPHATADRWAEFAEHFSVAAAFGLGILGLAERTAVVSPGAGGDGGGQGRDGWLVVGEGEVRWQPPGGELIVAGAGDRIALGGDAPLNPCSGDPPRRRSP